MDSRKDGEELAALLMKGDDEGFLKLVQAFQDRLLNFFYRLTWDRHISEDLTQEVFYRIYRSIGRSFTFISLTAFVFTVAKNIWIDYGRSKKRRVAETHPSQFGNKEGDGSSDFLSQVPQKGPSPLETLIGKETQERLKKALNRLTFEKRMVFVMGDYLDIRYEEIAEILQIPVGTVKSRMHSAIKDLRSFLEES